MRSEPHFEFSCEVVVKDRSRRTVYGRTRAEILGDTEYLARLFDEPWIPRGPRSLPVDWQDDLVVVEKRIALGLGSQWTRATRGFDEYGDPAK